MGVGAEVGAAVGWAVSAGVGMKDGEGPDSAAGTWEGAVVGTGVIAGSGVLSAYIWTICSAGAAQPESSTSKAKTKNKIFFIAYPFKTIYTF